MSTPEIESRSRTRPPGWSTASGSTAPPSTTLRGDARVTRAELIGGVVHMASPLGLGMAIRAGRWPFGWIITPNSRRASRSSRMPRSSSTTTANPSRTVVLRILPEFGGRTRDDGEYYCGRAPELVVEVSDSTLERPRPQAGRLRAGRGPRIRRARGRPARRPLACPAGREAGRDPPERRRPLPLGGLPGLWLDPVGVAPGRHPRLRATVDRGVATPEHAEFVARLAGRAREAPGGVDPRRESSDRWIRSTRPSTWPSPSTSATRSTSTAPGPMLPGESGLLARRRRTPESIQYRPGAAPARRSTPRAWPCPAAWRRPGRPGPS